jgi:hypothetical protein
MVCLFAPNLPTYTSRPHLLAVLTTCCSTTYSLSRLLYHQSPQLVQLRSLINANLCAFFSPEQWYFAGPFTWSHLVYVCLPLTEVSIIQLCHFECKLTHVSAIFGYPLDSARRPFMSVETITPMDTSHGDCCAGPGSGCIDLPAAQIADIQRKTDQLVNGLQTGLFLNDHSGLCELAAEVRNKVYTWMRPLPSCREAVLEMREIVMVHMLGKSDCIKMC